MIGHKEEEGMVIIIVMETSSILLIDDKAINYFDTVINCLCDWFEEYISDERKIVFLLGMK